MLMVSQGGFEDMDNKRDDLVEAAQTLSELGASKGGKARAQKLTSDERKEIARHAAASRWSKVPAKGPRLVKATHGSPDRPLRIGDLEIPCYVLEDGRRVLVQRGMM